MAEIDSTENLLKVISSNNVIIYGAGYIARRFIRGLKKNNLDKKVIEVVTTNGSDEEIYGFKVKSIDSVIISEEDLICIAVHESIKDDIIYELRKREIEKYAWVAPYAFEMIAGYPISKDVKVPLHTVWRAERERVGIPIRCLVIDQFKGLNDCGFKIYLHHLNLFNKSSETSKKRLYYFLKFINDVDKGKTEKEEPISITNNGDIIDGTHRTAIAIWKNHKEISCDVYNVEYNEVQDDRTNTYISDASNIGFADSEIKEIKRMRDMIDRQMEN